MAGPDKKKSEAGGRPAWTYNRPSAGLSKGSKQGFAITAIVALILFVIVFVMGVPPGSPRATFADFLLAAGLSALGVWGVGGMIEISGSIRDLSIKAGGGIAILVLVMFVYRPFYGTAVDTSFDEDFEVSEFGSIGVLLSAYEGQFFRDESGAIQLVIPENDRDRIMRFKAEPVGQVGRYTANWDLLRQRNPRLEILAKISARQTCLSFVEEADGRVVARLDGELKENEIPGEDGTVLTCARN